MRNDREWGLLVDGAEDLRSSIIGFNEFSLDCFADIARTPIEVREQNDTSVLANDFVAVRIGKVVVEGTPALERFPILELIALSVSTRNIINVR